jgi:HKD family nuclease
MENPALILNDNDNSVKQTLRALSASSDEVRIAVAFLCPSDLIDSWLNSRIKLSIVVALSPPTNPSVLKQLLPYPASKIEVKFRGSDFHSKFYLFLKKGKPFSAILGSSNFTSGGLENNTESNVHLKDKIFLNILVDHFDAIWKTASSLSPEDVAVYQEIYKQAMRFRNKEGSRLSRFERLRILPRFKQKTRRPKKEARDYLNFWKCVDDIVDLVKPITKRYWPDVPPYISVDNFFSWIVTGWSKEQSNATLRRLQNERSYVQRQLPHIFREFAIYQKANNDWPIYAGKNSRRLQIMLSRRNISSLTKSQAREIYAERLYSGGMRTRRFQGDKQFINDNSIQAIRKAFDYLLWSTDEIDQRISALLPGGRYKLHSFGASNVQELVGWVRLEYPIRNDEADKGIEILGYKFR